MKKYPKEGQRILINYKGVWVSALYERFDYTVSNQPPIFMSDLGYFSEVDDWKPIESKHE